MTGGIFYTFLRKRGQEMKKLFISQPMSGKADEEILAERKVAIKAAEELLREPVEVIDSFFQSAPVGAKPLWFIGKSLEFYLMPISPICKRLAESKRMQDRT